MQFVKNRFFLNAFFIEETVDALRTKISMDM